MVYVANYSGNISVKLPDKSYPINMSSKKIKTIKKYDYIMIIIEEKLSSAITCHSYGVYEENFMLMHRLQNWRNTRRSVSRITNHKTR
jgi:hypothetical protein